MKAVHYLSIALVIVAIALFAAGLAKAAGLAIGLSIIVELVGSAVTGKQTNDEER